MAAPARKHHALAIPLPVQGHLNPLKRLCETLAASHGFTITFLNIDPIRNFRVAEASLQPQESNSPQQYLHIRQAHIRCEALEGSIKCMQQFLQALQTVAPCIEQLLQQLNQQDLPVTCLISDFSMTLPTQAVADKFNIPRITLFPSSASMLLLVDYALDGVLPIKEVLDIVMNSKTAAKRDVFHDTLPGLPTLTNRDLLNTKHQVDENVFIYGFLMQQLHNCKEKAQAMVVNSVEEVEPAAFETLSARLKVPVYAIGPLMGSNTSLWKEEEGCIEWLDKQPTHSVLFISLGSTGEVTLAQFEEILAALLSSGWRFMLVFRPGLIKGSGGAASFPLPDFLARTRDQGHVVGWAPQIAVLSHPSVGAFLTHCGWNSTLEAITCGVPMICFPYMYDQFLNAKCVVEVWKIGFYLAATGADDVVERDEVERVINSVMEGEQSKAIRANAAKLRDASCPAILPGGTSHGNIEGFINSLSV